MATRLIAFNHPCVKRKVDLRIRGIPSELRERLRRRAARKSVSMTQYVTQLIRDDLSQPTRKREVIQILRDDIQRPTMREWLKELHKDPPVRLPRPVADYLREARREEGEP